MLLGKNMKREAYVVLVLKGPDPDVIDTLSVSFSSSFSYGSGIS
jgi:hypothetical protein